MDRCSYFIKDIALFGSYPCQNTVKLLESKGVEYFVNLTYPTESKIKNYHTVFTKMQYSFTDNSIPEDVYSFCSFIFFLSRLINVIDDKKLYLHCKGGHGRSGVVVACICFIMFSLSSQQALSYTSLCHSKRVSMRKKWRNIGSPQTHTQKNFVKSICKFIDIPEELLIDSPYKVKLNENNYNSALHAFLDNKRKYNCPYELLDKILLLRTKQNRKLKDILKDTFLSKFICYNIKNNYDIIFIRCINNLKLACFNIL